MEPTLSISAAEMWNVFPAWLKDMNIIFFLYLSQRGLGVLNDNQAISKSKKWVKYNDLSDHFITF